ncbi:MAG TPA: M20/M25/M40 family metallo-hydrolase [bacterium]|nr:M20/M25/M40 family metallo-hydrolase [bacterium]
MSTDTPDGSRTLLDDVRAFAFPRFAGTAGERRAGDLLQQRFEGLGLAVVREPFTTSRHVVFRWRLFLHAAVALAVVALAVAARAEPRVAALLGAALLATMVGLGRWRRGLESSFDVGETVESENVVARRPATDPRAVRAVVVAHRDSKSSALPTLVPGLIILAVALFTLLVTAAAGVAWLAGSGPLVAGWLVPGGGILAALLVAVAFNRPGDRSPGALDNASGLAVLLRAAERLAAGEDLRSVDLTFLATGAEEIGLAGALRWIQAHEAELDPERTIVVNVDSVGVGTTLLAADLRGRAPHGEPVAQLVRAAADAAGVRVRTAPFLPGAGVDSMPLGARGLPTVTILGQVFGAAAGRMHSPRDRVEFLDEKALGAAVDLVVEVVRRASGCPPGEAGRGSLTGSPP